MCLMLPTITVMKLWSMVYLLRLIIYFPISWIFGVVRRKGFLPNAAMTSATWETMADIVLCWIHSCGNIVPEDKFKLLMSPYIQNKVCSKFVFQEEAKPCWFTPWDMGYLVQKEILKTICLGRFYSFKVHTPPKLAWNIVFLPECFWCMPEYAPPVFFKRSLTSTH